MSGSERVRVDTAAKSSRPTRGGRLVARVTNLLGKARVFSVGGARAHAAAYRRSKGRLGRKWFGAEILVLETIGRKSGKARSTPVIYVREGTDFAVVAANAGNGKPAWLLNLEHSGHALVVLDGRRTAVSARRATPEERGRLWPKLVANYPANARYPEFAGHELPVVLLTPVRTDG